MCAKIAFGCQLAKGKEFRVQGLEFLVGGLNFVGLPIYLNSKRNRFAAK